MEYKTLDGINSADLISIGDYVDFLKNKTGNTKITNQTIHYQLAKNPENLDFVKLGSKNVSFIIFNKKAKNYVPGENYGTPRRSKMSF